LLFNLFLKYILLFVHFFFFFKGITKNWLSRTELGRRGRVGGLVARAEKDELASGRRAFGAGHGRFEDSG
jgi:hypothetical protein